MASIGEPKINRVINTPQSAPPYISDMVTQVHQPMSMFHRQDR